MIQKKQEFVAIFFEAVDNVRNLCYRISEFFCVRRNMRKKLLTFFEMTAGSLFMAIGVYFFKIQNGFSTGGVSGVATLLGNIVPYFTPGSLIMIINVLLLLIGFIVLGKETGLKTVYCSLLFSGATWLLEWIVPMSAPLTNELFLELVYAIMITGIGSAILFDAGASSGGTDIVALILKKYTSLDVGKALLCTDCVIAAMSFFVFGVKIGLYSMIGLFAKAFLVDGVIESMHVCKSFMIITENPAPIVEFIIKTLNHSATTVDAIGEYSRGERKMVFTLCKRMEASRLKAKIRELDPKAFVIVQTTSEIIGRGFRSV